jgi:quercetin dioxygenase-like cupin family protein
MTEPDTLVQWDTRPEREIIPGFHARFMHSAAMTFVSWRIDKGARLPEHHHVHEQVIHVLEGDFQVTLDGHTSVIHADGVAVVPSNARHSAVALTDCRVLDVFWPVREDYREGGTPLIAQALAGETQ